MKLSNNFSGAKMNKDLDERFIQKGEMINAENIRVGNSESSDVGSIENSLGNIQLTNLDLGTNVKTIGGISDTFEDTLYWFTTSDTINAILEWSEKTSTLTTVLYDSRAGANNVLNFSEDNLITGVNIITDSDNNRRFLAWNDNRNEPRMVNISTAKKFSNNGFTDDDISLILKAPINAPTIGLRDVPNRGENKIAEKLLVFAYRYRYEDEQYSALSPYSEVAFEPNTFSYDYSTGTNEAMVNKFNTVDITFDTGDSLVIGLDLVVKESNSNEISIIQSFVKEDESWPDNSTAVFTFSDNKGYRLLPSDENNRLYDNVPRKALAQDVIDNRLVFGNYLENYNIIDNNGNDINVDFSVTLSQTNITSTSPVKSLKSNREYEFGIVYLDSKTRMTTPLISKNNVLSIPNDACNTQNRATIQIDSFAPDFATHYKFFIKQPQEEYDTITPVVFFQDGVFIWIKLEGDDVDKISKGDFLYVKSDTSGILDTSVQTEVLDIVAQSDNFLEEDSVTDIIQEAGTYFKVKPSNFSLNQNSASTYDYETKGFKSRNTSNNITGNQNYIEEAVYYGLDGLNDLTESGTYTGTDDIRYIIEIDAEGTPDTFRWSDDDGASYTSGVSITGSSQALSNGVSITFSNTTGHDTNDRWIVSAKSEDPINEGNSSRRAWAAIKGKPRASESIIGGAQIILKYSETRDDQTIQDYRTTFITTQNYANLEEWFFEDNIISQLDYPATLDRIYFRRGNPINNDPPESMDIDPTGDMFMVFRSSSSYSGGQRITIVGKIEIVELENNIIFETIPQDDPSEIFFELSETFTVNNGLHEGQTVTTIDGQIVQVNPAVHTLSDYNCFAWNNGFESYKIKDKFTQPYFKFNSRPSIPLQNYRENRRIASMIYSGLYQQESNFNSLNEFNVSLISTKDLDDRYGSIQKIYARDTDLVVFQEDKVHKVMYNKSILFNADGTGNVSQNENVLGQEVAYSGEYGISTNPESFAFFGNRIWWTDAKRGVVLRLGGDGILEISDIGMRDFFRDYFTETGESKRLGAYDPYFDQYVLNIKDEEQVTETVFECGTTFSKFNISDSVSYTLNIDDFTTSIDLSYVVTTGSISFIVVYDGSTTVSTALNGSGTFSVPRTNQSVSTATITVVPSVSPSTYQVTHLCPVGSLTTIKHIMINDIADTGFSGVLRYQINPVSPFLLNESIRFDLSGISLFESKQGLENTTGFPQDGDTIQVELYFSDLNDDDFDTTADNRIGYLVSTTNYNISDIDTILSQATFPTLSQVDSFGERVYRMSFTFNKPSEDHILYLIWDYEDTVVIANDDSATVFNGDFVDINVLANDNFIGEGTVLIQSAPANGTLNILTNQLIRYTHNGLNTDPDSFVYQMSNGISTDTATVNITVNSSPPPGGGGGGNPGIGFAISSSGASDPDTACGFTFPNNKFHDGLSSYPTLDDFVYNDVNKTTVFDGGNLWYSIENSRAIQIESTGRILSTYFCGQSGGGGFE